MRETWRRVNRLRHYLDELLLCLRVGAGPTSKIRLAVNTVRFHLRNARVHAPLPAADRDVTYLVRLGNDAVQQLTLRTYSGDLFVFHEIFVTNCYSIPDCLRRTTRSVVDLGANIGLATLFYSRMFPHATFACVEPASLNVDLLKRNLASLAGRVVIIDGAVRDRAGFADFDNSGWSWGGQIKRGGDVRVRCYTMDEIMKTAGLTRIDLLKVDIENGVETLFGSDNAWLGKVQTIVAELTSAYPLPAFARDVTPYGLTVLPQGSAYGNQMVMAVRFDARVMT